MCPAVHGDAHRRTGSTRQCAQSIDETLVVTGDEDVAEFVRSAGHQVLHDNDAGLCDALDMAAAELAVRGFDTALILPADIPTVTAADIDNLLARHDGGLSICPAIRDGGTNALMCSPPDAVAFCYGKNSAERHIQQAEAGRGTAHALARAGILP